MTDYARRTAAARRRTEARIELIREDRAANRRAHGPSTGSPSTRLGRQQALFPGFPLLVPAYAAKLPEGGELTHLQAAAIRDTIYAFAERVSA